MKVLIITTYALGGPPSLLGVADDTADYTAPLDAGATAQRAPHPLRRSGLWCNPAREEASWFAAQALTDRHLACRGATLARGQRRGPAPAMERR